MQKVNNQNIDFQPKIESFSYQENKLKKTIKIKHKLVIFTIVLTTILIFLIPVFIYYVNPTILPNNNLVNDNKYLTTYANNNLGKPFFNETLRLYVVTGLMNKSGNNTITAFTNEGEKTYKINSGTVLQRLIAEDVPSSKQGGALSSTKDYDFNSFTKEVKSGSFLMIFYTKDNNTLKAEKIYFLPDYKFKQ